MSTATDELVEIDVDLDAPVICRGVEGCEAVATFLGTCACPSRHTLPTCTEHKLFMEAELRAFDERMGYLFNTIVCRTCGAPLEHPYMTWRPL